MLDGEVLEEALRLSGERTYSATVDLALREFVRRARAERILELAGSGLWHGDLGEMRGDWAVSERKPRGRRRGSR
jgi:Arc/MetJ family transcription regulator